MLLYHNLSIFPRWKGNMDERRLEGNILPNKAMAMQKQKPIQWLRWMFKHETGRFDHMKQSDKTSRNLHLANKERKIFKDLKICKWNTKENRVLNSKKLDTSIICQEESCNYKIPVNYNCRVEFTDCISSNTKQIDIHHRHHIPMK